MPVNVGLLLLIIYFSFQPEPILILGFYSKKDKDQNCGNNKISSSKIKSTILLEIQEVSSTSDDVSQFVLQEEEKNNSLLRNERLNFIINPPEILQKATTAIPIIIDWEKNNKNYCKSISALQPLQDLYQENGIFESNAWAGKWIISSKSNDWKQAY